MTILRRADAMHAYAGETLMFDRTGERSNGTLIWKVLTRREDFKLGDVTWHKRRYVFSPVPGDLQAEWLREVAEFIDDRTKEHWRRSRKARTHAKRYGP